MRKINGIGVEVDPETTKDARNAIPLRIMAWEMRRRRIVEMMIELTTWLLLVATLAATHAIAYTQGKIVARYEMTRGN